MKTQKFLTILVEVLLLFILGVLLYQTIVHFRSYHYYVKLAIPYGEYDREAHEMLSLAIVFLFAIMSDIAAMILIVLREIKSIMAKLDAKIAVRREARAAARVQKAEADKKKRIEELQSELDELKKDN